MASTGYDVSEVKMVFEELFSLFFVLLFLPLLENRVGSLTFPR